MGIFNHAQFDVIGPKLPSAEFFKITDFGTDRKPICDFLLVINRTYIILSRTVSKSLQIIGQICAFQTVRDRII